MKMKHAVAGTIYKTMNYDEFERSDLQRKVRPGNLKKVRKSMEKKGFLLSCPISVYVKNGKLHLNNGHHRLFVAMQLGLMVYFVIEPAWSWDDLKDEGMSGQRWTADDMIHGEALRGNEDYKTLVRYAAKGIPPRFVASMLHGETAGSGNASAKVFDGSFKVNTTELIDKLVDFLEDMKAVSPVVATQSFMLAVAVLPVKATLSTS